MVESVKDCEEEGGQAYALDGPWTLRRLNGAGRKTAAGECHWLEGRKIEAVERAVGVGALGVQISFLNKAENCFTAKRRKILAENFQEAEVVGQERV